MAIKAKPAEIEEINRRFNEAKEGWSHRFKNYRTWMRVAFGDQWDAVVRSARKEANRPMLSFGVLHTFSGPVTNKIRSERPRPKIEPVGHGASQETAEVWEGHFRHIDEVSNGSMAYDHASHCAVNGGFGYVEFDLEYVGDPDNDPSSAFNQEPRVRRIMNPLSVLFDPKCEQLDFSDSRYYFKMVKLSKDEYIAKFKREPVTDFENDDLRDSWTQGDFWYVAEYVYTEEGTRRFVELADGNFGYADELEFEESEVVRDRDICDLSQRKVYKCLFDGANILEKSLWPGAWLPMLPVLGLEVIVDDKIEYKNVFWAGVDGTKLGNGILSNMAEQLQKSGRSGTWFGPEGSMPGSQWSDSSKSYGKFEYRQFDQVTHMPLEKPELLSYEPQVQNLMLAGRAATDTVRQSVGYTDTVINASQADLSGIAVKNRQEQQSASNAHFYQNLVMAQWHGGRILLDLDIKTTDTARSIRIMKADGVPEMVAVTMANEAGITPKVKGYEDKKHFVINGSEVYACTIKTGKSDETRLDEEKSLIIEIAKADPQVFVNFLDIIFDLYGYPELAARAKLMLPPAIQASFGEEGKDIPPEMQGKMMQLAQKLQMSQQQLQSAGAIIQKLTMEKQAKVIETAGKIRTTELQTASAERIAHIGAATDITVQDSKHRHEAAGVLFDADTDFIKHLSVMEQEAMMATAPPAEMGVKQGIDAPESVGGMTA